MFDRGQFAQTATRFGGVKATMKHEEAAVRKQTARRARPAMERLEDRMLMAVGVLPEALFGDASQVIFAPDRTELDIPLDAPGVSNRLYEFAVDGPGLEVPVTFRIVPDGGSDAAIGLYDDGGNLIAEVDSDALPGQPGNEALATMLQSDRSYVVGVFFGAGGQSEPFKLTVESGPQVVNPTIVVDRASGTAQVQANTGEETFNSPRDVDYFPIDLTNAASAGTVVVTPTGLDVHPAATLFRRENVRQPWRVISSGVDSSEGAVGAPVTLAVTPFAGGNLTDAEYLVAVAPRNFDTAARSYQISVTTDQPMLGPASLSVNQMSGATNLHTIPPAGPGVAAVTITDMLVANGERLFRFRAPANGLVSFAITATSADFEPVLSVYNANGSSVLDVASRTQPGTLNTRVPVIAGAEYAVRVGDAGGNESGEFQLQIGAHYTPESLPFGIDGRPNVAHLDELVLATSQPARFFRIEPQAVMDAIVVEVDPGAGADPVMVRVGIAIPGENPIIQTATAAGQSVFQTVKIANHFGPFDLMIEALAGTDPVSLSVGRMDLPSTIALDSLLPARMSLAGDLAVEDAATAAAATQSAGEFGEHLGIRIHPLLASSGAGVTVITADGSGVRPVLAVYREQGGEFRLLDFVLPAPGLSHAEMTVPLPGDHSYGVVAVPMDFDAAAPGRTITLGVNGPDAASVGIGMVPVAPGATPGCISDPNPVHYRSLLCVKDIAPLDSDVEQHLWQTILPFNLTDDARPIVRFKPIATPNELQARVTALRADGSILGSQLSPVGGELHFTLGASLVTPGEIAAFVASLRGQTIRFRVEPTTGHAGDGDYRLEMLVKTTDPTPFELTEKSWKFTGSQINCNPDSSPGAPFQACDGTFPFVADPNPFDLQDVSIVQDIVQNQFGYGSAQGHFTSSEPYTAGALGNHGSIDVFRFWSVNPGPIVVRTVPIDPLVNTTIKLYRANFDAAGNVSFLTQIDTNAADSDWLPADRSAIDAQVPVNDFDLLKYLGDRGCTISPCYASGGGMYYAVVKNEQGTQGRYRIEVETPSFTQLGGVNPTLASASCDAFCRATSDPIAFIPPATGGSVTIQTKFAPTYTDFVGFFPIQLPDQHNGVFQVTSSLGSLWDLDLFDSAGNSLAGSESDIEFAGSVRTTGTFMVPSGPQTVFLRLQEQRDNSAMSNVFVTVGVNPVPFASPPPSALPGSITPTMLSTNQFGRGAVLGSVAGIGDLRAFAFRAPAGQLRVTVQPDIEVGGPRLRYAVYVDDKLVAWDVTPLAGEWATDSQAFFTEFTLPKARQPSDPSDFGYDRSRYQDVVVTVESLDTPVAAGGFELSVESNVHSGVCDAAAATLFVPRFECEPDRPMRDRVLAISPLASSSSKQTLTGNQWLRLDVPADIAPGSVTLAAEPTGFLLSTSVRYELFDLSGNLISAETKSLGIGQSSLTFTVTEATGGQSYFLRVARPSEPSTTIGVTATATIPKAIVPGLGRPAATITGFIDQNFKHADPTPDGKFSLSLPSNRPVAFWVDQPGIASFTATLDNNPSRYVALYRGNFRCPDEFCPTSQSIAELVDYTNQQNDQFGTQYNLTAYLEPGMYFLNTNDPTPAYHGALPAYRQHAIILDPEFGTSNVANLEAFDHTRSAFARGAADPLDSFRSTFYRVTTPAGSQAGVMTFASSYSCEDPIENGFGFLSLWTPAGDGFSRVSSPGDTPNLNDTVPPSCEDSGDATVTGPDATPHKEYVVAFHRQKLVSKVGTSAQFEVPVSGTPDLVVEPIVVLPAGGETRVDVTVRNAGYAPAFKTRLLYVADTAATPGLDIELDKKQRTLGPRAERTYSFYFDPTLPTDTFRFTTDYVAGDPDGNIEELDESNNTDTRRLCEPTRDIVGDCHRPVLSVSLADPLLDGTGFNDNVWGRYVAGATGVVTDIRFATTDGDGAVDPFRIIGHRPSRGNEPAGDGIIYFGQPNSSFPHWDLGFMHPTTPANPNMLTATAIDRWGLESDLITRTVQVVARPGWLHEPSTITFDANARVYQIHFENALIDYDKTVEQILGASVPFIGKNHNRFLVGVAADTTATLDPTPPSPITAPVSAVARLTLLDENVFDEAYAPGSQTGNQVQVIADLAIDPVTLETTSFDLTFGLHNINVADYQSPEIPLFSYGLSGVASLNANLYFSVSANLNAALTVAINPAVVENLSAPPMPLGLKAPSFVEPSVTLGANVEGEVEFLGFDLAELSGGVNFTLFVTVGLDSTDPQEVIAFGDIPSNLCVNLSGAFGIEFGASVLGIEVWGYEEQFPSFEITGSCDEGIITHDGTVGQSLANIISQAIAANLSALASGGLPQLVGQGPGETITSGDAPVGSLEISARPNIVIDPATGRGLFVQIVDPDTNHTKTTGRLATSLRADAASAWSNLATLPGTSHVSHPVLAFTNEPSAAGNPAVVVYQAIDNADPAALTRNAFVSGQDIRWRYFDGSAWLAEQPLTSDSLYDTNPVIAFGAPSPGQAPRGVAAWVHNTNPTPIGASGPDAGKFDRSANEIQVAVWNATAHAWGAVETLTVDNISDSNPAAYVDHNGRMIVAWTQDLPSGSDQVNRVLFSINDGSGWSAPAELPIIGLPAGGRIESLAIGSEGPGRIDVLVVHATKSSQPGEPIVSAIYNRPTTLAALDQPAAVEIVTEGANYSHLRTLHSPGGGLLAYWQESDGVTNEIFASHIGPAGSGNSFWARPFSLTNGAVIETSPSIAFDSDGALELVYGVRNPVDATPGGMATSAVTAVGSEVSCPSSAEAPPAASGSCSTKTYPLPELSFSRPVFFPYHTKAAAGSETEMTGQIVNAGAADTTVFIQYFEGLANENVTPIGTETILLAAGATYTFSHAVPVQLGTQTYCVQIESVTTEGLEAIGKADNTSCAAIEGLADFVVTNIELSRDTRSGSDGPVGQDEVLITATVRNLSGVKVGPFAVSFTGAAPSTTIATAGEIGAVQVPELAAFAETTVTIPWSVPDGSAFDIVLAAFADADESIIEANEFNNTARMTLGIRPDATVSDIPSPGDRPALPAVQATAFNNRGHKNVQVEALVRNVGSASLTNVPVQLFWSWGEGSVEFGPYELAQTVVVPLLPARSETAVTFIANGLAGQNRYRVMVDAEARLLDADRTNNVNETAVQLNGLPDLTVRSLSLNGTAIPTASLYAAIENAGSAPARSIKLEVFAGNPESEPGGLVPAPAFLVGSALIDQIAPLSSMSLNVPLDMAKLAGRGVQELCVVVNRDDSTAEHTDANNINCQTVVLDSTSPQVTDIRTIKATARKISRLGLQFSEAMNPAMASTPTNYRLFIQGRDRKLGTSDDIRVAVKSAEYNPLDNTVTLTPAKNLPTRQFFRVRASASLADLAGNQLDGNGDGTGGDDFEAYFASGSSLRYTDSSRDAIALSLSRGFVEMVLDSTGEVRMLRLLPAGQATLTGSVRRPRNGEGIAYLPANSNSPGVNIRLPGCLPARPTHCFEPETKAKPFQHAQQIDTVLDSYLDDLQDQES